MERINSKSLKRDIIGGRDVKETTFISTLVICSNYYLIQELIFFTSIKSVSHNTQQILKILEIQFFNIYT